MGHYSEGGVGLGTFPDILGIEGEGQDCQKGLRSGGRVRSGNKKKEPPREGRKEVGTREMSLIREPLV